MGEILREGTNFGKNNSNKGGQTLALRTNFRSKYLEIEGTNFGKKSDQKWLRYSKEGQTSAIINTKSAKFAD